MVPDTRICVEERVKLRDVLRAWASGAMKWTEPLLPAGLKVVGSTGADLDVEGSIGSLRRFLPARRGALIVPVRWPAVPQAESTESLARKESKESLGSKDSKENLVRKDSKDKEKDKREKDREKLRAKRRKEKERDKAKRQAEKLKAKKAKKKSKEGCKGGEGKRCQESRVVGPEGGGQEG